MGGKHWSEEDKERLKRAYESRMHPSEIVGLFPGRTERSVVTFASKSGFQNPDRRPWTPKEEKILREIWQQPRILKVGLARLPGRTYDAVRVHAKDIGLGDKLHAQKGTRSPYFNAISAEIRNNGPRTSNELSKILSIPRRTIQGVMKDCRGAEFHVGSWKFEGCKNLSMVWAFGPGPDAPKPAPKSSSEVCRNYDARKKIKLGKFNPFLTAAGLVVVPESKTGRVYSQDMTGESLEVRRKAA